MTFEEARALFPALQRVAYLNAGTFGPLARPTLESMTRAQERDLVEGRTGLPFFHAVLDERARLRARVAELVGAEPAQVALTSSTTEGCNIVVAGLGLGPDDEVVTTTDEHFGLLGALGTSGARVVVVPPDPERILAAVTARTRLLALSHVLWTTGAVLPVGELRERSGVPVLADGAQSVGAMPVDVAGLDFVTISGQKWLCGPDATGALVVADPERLRVTAPSYLSQSSYDPDGSFEPSPGAARFEQGWWPAASLAGVATALSLRPPWWFDRAWEAAERCRSLLERRVEVVSPAQRATLVSFRPEGEEPAALVERLRLAGVAVRDVPRTGLVRVSCGWWTSDADVDRLLEAL